MAQKNIGLKTFGDTPRSAGKKITVREFKKSDLKRAGEFAAYMNSFNENDLLLSVGKTNAKEEIEFLNGVLKRQKNKTGIYLIAEHNGKIIGTTDIDLMHGRAKHVAEFGIRIKDGYRGIGLGNYMMSEVMKRSIKKLKPTPKMFYLQAFAKNAPAIDLYKRMGFKLIARIPKEREYKGKLVDGVIMTKLIKK